MACDKYIYMIMIMMLDKEDADTYTSRHLPCL